MSTYLVTGPSGFLGHHVILGLNQRGVRPRVLRSSTLDPTAPAVQALERLDVDPVVGDLDVPDSLVAACQGVDVVLHLDFGISLGEGMDVEEELHAGNVVGTRNLVRAARDGGVRRLVLSSSALAVGISQTAAPLDETASWDEHAFHLPYAMSRRTAELESLARESTTPEIVVVSPSFTLGPEDFVGAPANGLARKMSRRRFRITAPIAFGMLDVRDYAQGVIAAAERGTPGARYLLNGHNLDARKLARAVARNAGRRPPRLLLPIPGWLARLTIRVVGVWSHVRGRSSPVSPALAELWHRHAWYDASRAGAELGWQPRPLEDSLRDALAWEAPGDR